MITIRTDRARCSLCPVLEINRPSKGTIPKEVSNIMTESTTGNGSTRSTRKPIVSWLTLERPTRWILGPLYDMIRYAAFWVFAFACIFEAIEAIAGRTGKQRYYRLVFSVLCGLSPSPCGIK
jgi:hypothetical protein